MTRQIQSAPAAIRNLPTNADSAAPNLSDLLVAYLELLGVEYIFGVPGGHNVGLYEALDKSAKRGRAARHPVRKSD